MAEVIFYLQKEGELGAELPLHALACHLCAHYYGNKQRVIVLCDNQGQAEQVDELLWQLPDDRFVPHNLTGEGPASGTPVEICWQPPRNIAGKHLINLTPNLPVNANKCRLIADFVAVDEAQKQLARTRYKQYRAEGHTLHTEAVATIIESNHG